MINRDTSPDGRTGPTPPTPTPGRLSPRPLSPEEASALLDQLLDTPFWPAGLNPNQFYRTKSDDNPQAEDSHISVVFSRDGDGWIEVQSFIDPQADIYTSVHRFRTWNGGGRRQRIRNALLFLARAIQLDQP